jgi:hypothetical protein
MAMQNWAINLRPDEVEEKLRAVGGFQDGRIVWTKIPLAFPQVHFQYRWDSTNNPSNSIFQKIQPDAALLKINRLIKYGQPVLLNVSNGMHWVVAYRSECGLLINDPLSVGPEPYEKKYGNPLKTLWGFAVLIGPPVAFNDDVNANVGQGLNGGMRLITDPLKRKEFVDLFV